MGWRKLTVRDGGLARCCAAQRPIICGANLRFVLMRQHYPWQSDSGLLGPDLRVLILLEYPGVSPRGSLVNVHGERSGRAEGLP
jgi:hypothetical protein